MTKEDRLHELALVCEEIAALTERALRNERWETALFYLMIFIAGVSCASVVGAWVIEPAPASGWSVLTGGCTLLMALLGCVGYALLRQGKRLKTRLQHLRFLRDDEMMRHGHHLSDRAHG
jgi:hypothetical protein